MREYPLEKVIERYLCDKIKRLGGHAYKFNSQAHRSVPDRIVVLPDGRTHYVEVKTIGGKLSSGQKREIARLRSMKQTVHVIWTKAGVDEYIRGLQLHTDTRLSPKRCSARSTFQRRR